MEAAESDPKGEDTVMVNAMRMSWFIYMRLGWRNCQRNRRLLGYLATYTVYLSYKGKKNLLMRLMVFQKEVRTGRYKNSNGG
jgi:hypothetical protein